MYPKINSSSLNILYEDNDILVCVKSAGIASETRKTGQQDIVSLLRNYRSRKGEESYIGLIHRLDQPVEGIQVFGKNQKSTALLSGQLAKGIFTKHYLAVTEGTLPQTEGILQDYLKKDTKNNISRIVSENEPQAKKAKLEYCLLGTVLQRNLEDCRIQISDAESVPDIKLNLVRIRLYTGRHHQIRVQMAHLGTPLAGDKKYGALTDGAVGLCAFELKFLHPVAKKEMHFAIKPSQPVFQKFSAYLFS